MKRVKLREQAATSLSDLLFDRAGAGLCLVAPDGTVVRANDEWLRSAGLGREEVVGRRFLELFPGAREVGRAAFARARAGEAVDVPRHVQRIGGRERWWEGRVAPIPMGGATGFLVTARDVTAEVMRQRAADAALGEREARLRLALEAGQLVVWEVDVATDTARVSEGASALIGLPRGMLELPNAAFLERVHPDDREEVARRIAGAVERGEEVATEFRVTVPDGTTRWIATRGRAFCDAQRGSTRVIGVGHDVTERRRAEEAARAGEAALRASEEALREAARRKDDFLATLSHELRNPLAAIASAARVIHARCLAGQDVERPIQILERQVRNSARILEDLLDVSRITRGLLQLRREPVLLETVIHGAVDSQRALLDAAGHRLTITLPHEPILVDGDPTRLEQIFSNLLNNAAKYTPDRGRIALVVERVEDGVAVRVTDSGNGIAPDLLPRVFDLFVQEEQCLARSRGGLGLGLTLVRRLVELHGGTVEARSAGPGAGSEFTVRLPALRLPVVPAARPAPCSIGRRCHRRILVVEDNVDAAELLAEYLTSLGHEVTVAHDGAAALDAAADVSPDVVLLDIGLPGIDGYEVARRMARGMGARTPALIALTGYGQEEDRARSREAGFAHHLTKPFEPAALERLLAALPPPAAFLARGAGI